MHMHYTYREEVVVFMKCFLFKIYKNAVIAVFRGKLVVNFFFSFKYIYVMNVPTIFFCFSRVHFFEFEWCWAELHALVIKRRKLQREVWLTKLGEELEPTKHFFVENRNELLLRLRAWHGQNPFPKKKLPFGLLYENDLPMLVYFLVYSLALNFFMIIYMYIVTKIILHVLLCYRCVLWRVLI